MIRLVSLGIYVIVVIFLAKHVTPALLGLFIVLGYLWLEGGRLLQRRKMRRSAEDEEG